MWTIARITVHLHQSPPMEYHEAFLLQTLSPSGYRLTRGELMKPSMPMYLLPHWLHTYCMLHCTLRGHITVLVFTKALAAGLHPWVPRHFTWTMTFSRLPSQELSLRVIHTAFPPTYSMRTLLIQELDQCDCFLRTHKRAWPQPQSVMWQANCRTKGIQKK